jgi:hypothetical protein
VAALKPHSYLRVRPSPEFVASLEAMCGPGSVHLFRETTAHRETRGS